MNKILTSMMLVACVGAAFAMGFWVRKPATSYQHFSTLRLPDQDDTTRDWVIPTSTSSSTFEAGGDFDPNDINYKYIALTLGAPQGSLQSADDKRLPIFENLRIPERGPMPREVR